MFEITYLSTHIAGAVTTAKPHTNFENITFVKAIFAMTIAKPHTNDGDHVMNICCFLLKQVHL